QVGLLDRFHRAFLVGFHRLVVLLPNAQNAVKTLYAWHLFSGRRQWERRDCPMNSISIEKFLPRRFLLS
ncbi:hypothetical protein, partial [Haloferula sp. A504]|uniref:hypothetical protein n=1 Tax=Haloferula sp. A504 TaxID=3373601 RepID=UPI0031BEA323|nr:hypothetical protein [Verrucomicrobiaceae bacterium E54]